MDQFSTILAVIGSVLAVVGVASFVFAYFRSNLAKETIELGEKNRQELEIRVKSLEDADYAKQLKIKDLESQIEIFKTLPLEKLADSYGTMAATLKEVSTTQRNILKLISQTAH